ncbi:AraC family transcriptional regulator [Flavitalea antarctica]
MKPVLEHLPREAEESFVVKGFDYKYFPTPWHYHPEYELVLVLESSGKRFIGDHISDFSAGNLAFLGPNLPHLYRNDSEYYASRSKLRARSIVIHFLETSLGNDFLSLPEAKSLRSLFSKSARGLEVSGKTHKIVSEKMQELISVTGMRRWLTLAEILLILAESRDCKYISHETIIGHNSKESERLNKVFEFVLKRFDTEINISEVARLVNMAENSFSRYFSQRTRKTFSGFVNEIRLSHASKLLIETQKSISEICFECGFNNLSNFNRQFLQMYGLSPLSYRKQYYVRFDHEA